ncbi:MAG: hypothetical protein Q8R55_05590 [Candidatus Taylorbacteria bacterium]|nr:hypothetical protein [Candidatus Taylorbacteria bacterium]
MKELNKKTREIGKIFLISLFTFVWMFFDVQEAQAVVIVEIGNATANGTGTAVSVTHGVTIQKNDLVFAVVHANEDDAGGQTNISDNNGASSFTETFEEDHPGAGTTDSRYAIYVRRAGASEPSSYAWTLASSQGWTVQVRVFRGVHSDIWDVTPGTGTRNSNPTSGGTTTLTAPTMTVNTTGALGIVLVMTDGNLLTYSNPTNGYNNAVEMEGVQDPQASYTRIWVAGASGTTQVTQSATNDFIAHQFALKPFIRTWHLIRGGVKIRGLVKFR